MILFLFFFALSTKASQMKHALLLFTFNVYLGQKAAVTSIYVCVSHGHKVVNKHWYELWFALLAMDIHRRVPLKMVLV